MLIQNSLFPELDDDHQDLDSSIEFTQEIRHQIVKLVSDAIIQIIKDKCEGNHGN